METKLEGRIMRYVSAKRPVMIWGDPGTGKTKATESAVQRMGGTLAYYHPMSAGEVGMRGMPHLIKGELRWSLPDFLREINDGANVIFIDEINADRASMPLTMRLINERIAGTHRIPDSVAFVCAGNSAEQTGNDMPVALSNRMAHVHHEVDKEDFLNNFIAWGPEREVGARTAVVAFLKSRPSMISVPPPTGGDAFAYPTPRSWAMFATVAAGSARRDWREIAAECVGQGAAADSAVFWKTMALRNREQIAAEVGRGQFVPSSEMSTAFAEASSFVGHDMFHDLLRSYVAHGQKAMAKAAQMQHTDMLPKLQLPKDLKHEFQS